MRRGSPLTSLQEFSAVEWARSGCYETLSAGRGALEGLRRLQHRRLFILVRAVPYTGEIVYGTLMFLQPGLAKVGLTLAFVGKRFVLNRVIPKMESFTVIALDNPHVNTLNLHRNK
jgi:hypothetical protein